MLIEPVGIDPAGNGILLMVRRALMSRVNQKELLELVNDPRLRGYGETHDILAYLIYKHPEESFSFFLDNFSKLTVCGKANLIRALRTVDKQEIFKFLVMFLDDKTEVPYTRWDGKTPAGRMRICDYAFNSTSFLLKYRAMSPTVVPARLYPDYPVDIRDKYVVAMKKSWNSVSDKFLKIKKPIETKKVNFTEKLEKVKTDLKTNKINKDNQEDAGELIDTPDKLMDKMLQLSLAKKYDEMRKHIYDYQTDEVKDYVGYFINEIKKADPKKKGDFAYSDAAMKKLTAHFRNKFKAAEPHKLKPFRKDDKRLVNIPDENFKIFKEVRTFILVVKIGKEYKLIFWEGLDKLTNYPGGLW